MHVQNQQLMDLVNTLNAKVEELERPPIVSEDTIRVNAEEFIGHS